MTHFRLWSAAVAAGLTVFAGCSPNEATPSAGPDFHQELLRVSATYRDWGPVDAEARVAALDCRAPSQVRILTTGYSASPDAKTHGQKFYTLYAQHRSEYLALDRTGRVTVGQAIVKETWLPEINKPVPDPSGGPTDVVTGDERDIRKGDNWHTAGKPSGLFVMMKLDPKTPGTDDGWVYGTVSADGKTVTSAGKVESCMKCHQDARHDRLFGLPAE